jgi:hypothetical protein
LGEHRRTDDAENAALIDEAKLGKLSRNIAQRALMPLRDRRRSRLASRTSSGLISCSAHRAVREDFASAGKCEGRKS